MKYLIWSFKHGQWWRPNRMGYTPHLEEAGRYNAIAAGEIVTDSIMGDSVAVFESIAQERGAPTAAGLWVEAPA